MKTILCMIICVGIFFVPYVCNALDPHEVLVLANKYAPGSVGLAEYYMEKRGVPIQNLVKLWISDDENCSREDYDRKVVIPVRKTLHGEIRSGQIRCILVMYGLPLRIMPQKLSREEQKELDQLNLLRSQTFSKLQEFKDPKGEQAASLNHELENIKSRISLIDKKDQIDLTPI